MHPLRAGRGPDDEFRMLRERLALLESVASRLRADQPSVPGRMLVQAINPITISDPTSGQYIGVHPVGIVPAAVAEGAAPTLNVFSSVRPSVLLVGAASVAAGDLLLAMQGGNVWLADTGGGSGVPCTGQTRICVMIVTDGCTPPNAVIGATITVKDSATPPNVVGTCTTTGTVVGISLVGGVGGSGYTNGTGYPITFSGGGGSGAAGTFDVVGGAVTNLRITAGGSGYTTTPNADFSAAGAGYGAIASVTLASQCCITIANSGRYTVTCDLPGAATLSTSVVANCNVDTSVLFSYPANSLGYVSFVCGDCDNTRVQGATLEITPVGGGASLTLTTSGPAGVGGTVGVGSYTGLATHPSGGTVTIPFDVTACGTTDIHPIFVNHWDLYISAFPRFDAGTATWVCGCPVTVTATDASTGAVLATGSGTSSYDAGTGLCLVQPYPLRMTLTAGAIATTTLVIITVAFPNFTSTGDPSGINCSGSIGFNQIGC